jgi:hypothetical protein
MINLNKPTLINTSKHLKYITLGALPDTEGFYEACGYRRIFELHGQNIYQKILEVNLHDTTI